MRARNRRSDTEEAGTDLTPMIDVTFQLIIFFVVVTQISSQENVDLRLPDALAANPEPEGAERLFIVHIAPRNQGAVGAMPDEFGWFCYGDPAPRSPDEMTGILEREASLRDRGRGLLGRGQDGISENMVLVRCDARCPAGEFGKLIELMVQARMYRIKIAIMQEQRLR